MVMRQNAPQTPETPVGVRISPWRLTIVLTLPVAGLLLLLVSAFRIQVVFGAKHRATVESLSSGHKKVVPPRGFILDRANIPLALPTELPSANIDPVRLAMRFVRMLDPNITHVEYALHKEGIRERLHSYLVEFADTVSRIVHENPYIMREKLFTHVLRNQRQMYLKRHITEEEQKALEELALPSAILWFTQEDARHYPLRTMAAHVLGITGIDGHGIEGIEKKFDIELAGSPALVRVQKDARAGMLLLHGLPVIDNGGANHVVLTLDHRIQQDTESILEAALSRYRAKNGAAIVMDAKTGEILALANAPLVDLSNFSKTVPGTFRNWAVVDAYELGSVIKPLTMVGALDMGRIRPDSDIPLDFKVVFKDRPPWTPKDHVSLAQASIKPADIIARSSNRGIAKVAELMGEKALYEFFVKLGFGQPTGIELPSEASGVLPPLKAWSNKVYLATHSYGHGFSLSVLQLVQAYSLFANDGSIVQPHIVRYVVDDRGEHIACFSPDACNRPIPRREVIRNPQAVEEVRRMMRKVVTSGTGTRASLEREGYSIAGKTGTAEKLVQGIEGYSEHHNRVTFVGLLPAQSPQIIIAVMMDDPEGDIQDVQEGVDEVLRKDAGYVTAPVFANIARMVIRRLGILPDQERTTSVSTPAVAVTRIANRTSAKNPYFPPLPLPRKLAMPDLRGRPLAEVLDIMAENSINCSITGHGVVIAQTPEPGGPFAGCHLELTPMSETLPFLKIPMEDVSHAH